MSQIAENVASPPIGGFFEFRTPSTSDGLDVLAAWTEGRGYGAFVNARSAFAALASSLPGATLWLPAFVCRDMVSPHLAARIRHYPVLDGFEPDLAALDDTARAGDLVVFVAYFGLPLSAAVRAFAARRADLHYCEDRAQALDAGEGLHAGWRLFSPRKLLNVADGGLIVALGEAPAPQPSTPSDAEALWAPARLRAADPADSGSGSGSGAWHIANQAKEAAMTACGQAMTPLSLDTLRHSAIAPLAAARAENWKRLDARLHRWSALPRNPGAPPLGYVLILDPSLRDRVLVGLHARRIFAAVHWPALPVDPDEFPRETAWSRRLLTLPCDHRYGADEMDFIANAIDELMR